MEGKSVHGQGRGRGKAKETPTLDSLLEKLNRAKRIERGEPVEEVAQVQCEESNVPVLDQDLNQGKCDQSNLHLNTQIHLMWYTVFTM